jgi:translocation and assembly module TamB
MLSVLTWLFTSESGLLWAYREAQSRLPGVLSVEDISGRLAGLVRLEGVRYEDRGQAFKAGQVTVNWDPWALIKAEIDVSSLQVGALEVSLPESSDVSDSPEPDTTAPVIQLPLALKLRNAQIDGLVINMGDATYRIDQIRINARMGADRLEIEGLDIESPDLELGLRGDLKTSKNYPHNLELSWQTRLPSGAIMNGAGRIDGDLEATSLIQQVQGPLPLNLNLELRDLLGQLSWQVSIDSDSLDTTLLDPMLPRLKGAFDLTANGDLSTARVTGHVDAESAELGPFKAYFEMHNLDGERRFDGLIFDSLRVSALDGEISASGQFNWLPALGWQAEITSSAINPARLLPEWPGKINSTLTSNGGMENGELTASANIKQLQGSLRDYPVSLRGNMQWRDKGIDITGLDFASGDTRVNARGRIGERLDLDWSLDSSNLAELYPGAKGHLEASGRLDGPRETPTVQATFSGKFLGLPGYEIGAVKGDVALDLLRWQQLDVNLEAQAIKLQDHSLKSIKLIADTRRVQADIVAEEANAQIELDGKIDDESWRGRILKADIQTADFTNWKLKAPAAIGLSSDSLVAETICLQSLSGGEVCSSVNGQDDIWQMDLGVSKLPLQILAKWIPTGLQFDGLANAKANLVYRLPDQLLGRVGIELPEAAITYPVRDDRPERIDYRSGRLELLLEETGIRANTKISLNSGDQVEGTISLPGAKLLTLDYEAQPLKADARLRGGDLALVEAMIEAVEELKGQLDMNLTFAGTLGQPQVQGSARLKNAELNIPDLNLKLNQLNISVKSESSEKVTYRADALTAEGTLSASGSTLLDKAGGWPSELSFEGKRLDVSRLIERWLPSRMTVEGLLDASADLSFQAPDNLVGKIGLSSPLGVLGYPLLEGEKERWEYRDAKLDMVLNSRDIETSSEIRVGNNRLGGKVNLPGAKLLALDFESQSLRANARLDFQELELIEALLPEIEQMQGRLALDFGVDGTLAQPKLSGRAEILEAALLIPRLGLSIDKIKMTGSSDNDGQFNFDVAASSGEGNLSIQGTSRLNATEGWPTTISIKGDNFEIARIPEAAVTASPDLKVRLQNQAIDIQGDLLIPYAKLQPKDITTAARVSNDTVIVGGVEAPEPKWTVSTRVKLVLGDRVNFFGFGFEGRLGGRLLIEEVPGQLARGTGSINILEGRYRAYGQRLDIEKGRLLFTGGPLTNPGLDLRAVRKTNNVTAGIKVKGRLQQPQLELFSNPAMGQTNTLSYLLLGRPVESASGEEGEMMAKAALALGLAGGDQLARSIGDQFGLDEMRVESSDGGDQASLVVGRYLSPRLYVSYGVGLVEALNSLKLRYQISDRWQAEAVSGENQGADFLYSIER